LFAQPEPEIAVVPDPWMLELEEAVVVPKSQTSWTQRQMVLCLPPAQEVKEVERSIKSVTISVKSELRDEKWKRSSRSL